ncbi:MAG TPA: 3'-5' exonuclease [Trueperaceae bacterium]|nr:3'-5' exonuclease [Trueperaceae bacterium]
MNATDHERVNAVAELEAQHEVPVFREGQAIPRDLRTAEELESKGYPVPADVAAWLVAADGASDGSVTRSPLYSTSAARRGRGDHWLRPGRLGAQGPARSQQNVRSGLRASVASVHTPLRPDQSRKPSVSGDPRRWLGELFREGFVILDTETTGLSARDEIIEVAAVSSDGVVLFESRVWPRRGAVPSASTRIHGLTIEDLDGAPRWPDLLDDLHRTVAGHRILAWNAPFDERLSLQSSRAWGVAHPLPGFECAMRAYAYGRGVGSGSFKLERAASVEGVLVAGQTHRSADDAKLTLAVLTSLHRRSGRPA